jgi:hypothetical protein
MKFFTLFFFSGSFFLFVLLDPDPDPATQINADTDSKPWLIPKDLDVENALGNWFRRCEDGLISYTLHGLFYE